MKRLAPLLLLLAAATMAAAQTPAPQSVATPRAAAGEAVPGRLVVKLLEPSSDPAREVERLLAPLSGRFGRLSVRPWLRRELTGRSGGLHRALGSRHGLDRIMVVEYATGDDPRVVAAKLSELPGLAYVEPLYRRHLYGRPNDPLISRQWYLERIRAFDAWSLSGADSSTIIAIVDTGIDWAHPDLAAAIWRNVGELGRDAAGRDRRDNGVDDDGNGFIDDWTGYDFASRDGRATDNDPRPGHWHGTHVAGIAAGVGNNGIGIAGVAHGARLMAIKIADDNPQQPTLVNGYDALLYAVRMGATVINCSWGGGGRMHAEQDVIDAVTDAGALVVAAAGNDGQMSPTFPASYRGVLSVASVMDADRRSIFSNYSASVGISAPGTEIYSTLPTAQSPGGYGFADGTSMSSPMVAAAAAIVRSRYPSLDPAQISAVLRASADNIDEQNPDYRMLLGAGRLNVLRAITNGPNARLAGVERMTVADESGDGIIEPGEPFTIGVDVRNFLRPISNLKLTLEASPGEPVQVLAGTTSLGALATGESRTSDSGALRVVAPTGTEFDQTVAMTLTLSEGTETVATSRIEVLVNPNFSTTTNRRVTATFTGNGRIGFNDFPLNEQGAGFRIGRSDNLLAEGGLLIGTSPSRLADVVRSSDPGEQSAGLQTVRPYRVRFSDEEQAEIGTARFDDAHLLPMQRNGLEIDLTTYAYAAAGRDNQLLLLYRIRNTSSQTLERLHAALYLDWDIGAGGVDNQVRLDPENRLGYTYNVYGAGLPYTGAMLVGEQPMNFLAADNYGDPLSGGFYQEEKWEAISSGVRRDESSVGDCSMIIGAGPITLAPGADTTIAFSLMAGENLGALRAAAAEARAMLARFGMPSGAALMLPTTVDLIAGSPNPFVTSTRIEFTVPSEGEVELDVYNAIGEHVATLASGNYPRGIHTVEFAPGAGSSHVYFVRLVTAGQTMLRKILRSDSE